MVIVLFISHGPFSAPNLDLQGLTVPEEIRESIASLMNLSKSCTTYRYC